MTSAVAWSRLAPRRLGTRVLIALVGLLLLVQGAGLWLARGVIERGEQQQHVQALDTGERLWRHLLAQRAAALQARAARLAADPAGPGGAAEPPDAVRGGPPVVAAYLDEGLALRALHGGGLSAAEAGPVLRAAAPPRGGPSLLLLGSRPHQFVWVPRVAAGGGGWLALGAPLDGALLAEWQALSALHGVVLSRLEHGAPAVAASTLDEAASRVIANAGDDAARLDGQQLASRRVALVDERSRSSQLVMLHAPAAAASGKATLPALLAGLALLGALAVAAAGWLGARGVTAAMRRLTGFAERLGRGEDGAPLPDTGRADEIGDLARALDTMRLQHSAQSHALAQVAYRDKLTGLPNRARLRAVVQQSISAAGLPAQRRLALVVLGLDRFKHVNDVLGHAFGDRLLKAVAERLQGQVRREQDLVARIAGDAFALLLPEGDAGQAQALVARIVASCEVPLTIDGQTVDLEAAFGIACWPANAADAETLLERAETAMLAAKRQRARMLVYEPAIDAASAQTQSLLAALEHAVAAGELRLYVQPKVSLADGRLVGAEALVRWLQPGHGLVPPVQFIPLAERTGFVRQLTMWMFDEAARQWPALHAAGVQRLSLNLSARDLLDQELPLRLEAVLMRRRVPAEAFCLEITERSMIEDPQRAEATVHALAAGGFRLSIDDFGSGHSSLAVLKQLPVHELKIDKDFVIGMAHDPDDAKVVRAAIELAHGLGLVAVAEGVEDGAAWRQLQALDCDEAQGYWIGRPMPAAELPAFAARWAAGGPGVADGEDAEAGAAGALLH